MKDNIKSRPFGPANNSHPKTSVALTQIRVKLSRRMYSILLNLYKCLHMFVSQGANHKWHSCIYISSLPQFWSIYGQHLCIEFNKKDITKFTASVSLKSLSDEILPPRSITSMSSKSFSFKKSISWIEKIIENYPLPIFVRSFHQTILSRDGLVWLRTILDLKYNYYG